MLRAVGRIASAAVGLVRERSRMAARGCRAGRTKCAGCSRDDSPKSGSTPVLRASPLEVAQQAEQDVSTRFAVVEVIPFGGRALAGLWTRLARHLSALKELTMTTPECFHDIEDISCGMPTCSWTAGVPSEEEAREQPRRVARMPFIHRSAAVTPDVHAGKGATIGRVIPTSRAAIPAAGRKDIGCGMMAVRTALCAPEVARDRARPSTRPCARSAVSSRSSIRCPREGKREP